MILRTLALVLGALIWISPAHALPIGVEAFGGYNTHGMEVWNDDLELANAAGGSFGDVGHTLTYGLGLRAWATPSWLIQTQWEPFWLSSGDPPTGRKLSFHTETVRLDLAWFPPSSRRVRFGLGAGLGYYRLLGAREAGGVRNADLNGDTFGAQFQTLGEWSMQPHFALTGALGYRLARIADTKVNGEGQHPPIETNYSGFLVRLGLAFTLMGAN